MQYRFKVIHENEDPIYTDWKEESPVSRVAQLTEVHAQYPLASVATEFQGAPTEQYAWLACPFDDKEGADKFAETMTNAGFKVRTRDEICIGVGGPQARLENMKSLTAQAVKDYGTELSAENN